jgi:hypothetical protein
MFAYPYGDHSDTTLEVAASLKIDVGCSTRFRPVRCNAHPLALPRMQVIDQLGDRFMAAIEAYAKEP